MIRHLFRLTWNRKRATALVFLELLGCFLILCAVATGVAFTVDNWRRPLGFDYRSIARVALRFEFFRLPVEQRSQAIRDVERVLAEVQALPEVEAAGLMENGPYSDNEQSWTFQLQSGEVNVCWSSITPDVPRAMGFKLQRGRWFEPADEALAWTPVVITANLARARFGNEDPLGRQLYSGLDKPDPEDPELRVVGVMADYRRHGETQAAPYAGFALARFLPGDPKKSDLPSRELMVRMRPGTGPQFEERLVRRVQALVPNWSIDVESLEHSRARWLRERLLPVVVAAVVAGFLLLMVGFGLVGVLWQSVTRRTSELGLRRALGATAGNLRGQIVGELVAVTAVAVAAGSVLFVQLPVLGAFGFIPVRAYLYGLVAATGVLYCFVVLCALYPGWMATRIRPAEALQHE